jgi:hypothetical protein
LLGISEGFGMGSTIASLTTSHDAYRWLCGGVPVDADNLNEFRAENSAEIDQILTDVLVLLVKHGLLTLDRVAQDGMKVRASAGAASFRSGGTLKALIAEVRQHVEDVFEEAQQPNNPQSSYQRAARESAARDRGERVSRAYFELAEVEEVKRRNGSKSTPRASTTDPEARVMKMADGGFRPAYNYQLATEPKTRVVVGVYATDAGNDYDQADYMLDEVERRLKALPPELLVDGGYAKREGIEQAADRNVKTYAPVPQPQDKSVDRFAPNANDGEGAAEWRARMATPGAQAILKTRGETAELSNADFKDKRALERLRVRGVVKATTQGILVTIAHNMLLPVVAKLVALL